MAPDTPEFSRVQAHFTSTWDKGSCPQVDYILSVTNAKLESRWKIYRKELRHKDFERHFHGTKLTCNVVSQLSACGGEHCGVCGIAQNGMDGQCIHKNINFQRFGRGFYLAPNSSKCHDYTQTYQLQGPNTHRAMLLCDVLPGNKCYLQKRDPSLTAPPAGYDCVYGQVGGELNYEEIVVYNTESVMPRYVVLYRKDGVHKIAK